MVQYLENGDLAVVDGLRFRRDKHTGYFLNKKKQIRLHVYMYTRTHNELLIRHKKE